VSDHGSVKTGFTFAWNKKNLNGKKTKETELQFLMTFFVEGHTEN
jgi:hypothetical protein